MCEIYADEQTEGPDLCEVCGNYLEADNPGPNCHKCAEYADAETQGLTEAVIELRKDGE